MESLAHLHLRHLRFSSQTGIVTFHPCHPYHLIGRLSEIELDPAFGTPPDPFNIFTTLRQTGTRDRGKKNAHAHQNEIPHANETDAPS